MKTTLFLLCLLFGGMLSVSGQIPGSTPTPGEATQKVITPTRKQGIYDTQRSANQQAGRTQGGLVVTRNGALRKPTKEDLLLVAPDEETAAKYADFLRRPKTGLIRLLSDEGCQENANLVVASDFCVRYKNLFGGSTYSFRLKNYTLGRFSDVVYKNGVLYTVGKMTLGFLTDLGTGVSLDALSAETPGARYVFDFLPPAELPQIEAAWLRFQKGVEADGFRYQKFSGLEEDHTYLLRSVAYRKREQREGNKVIFDDLTTDERRDVIVALRVVKLAGAEKNSVTLLWKELRREEVSKVAVGKD